MNIKNYKKLVFIGDVHGKFSELQKLIVDPETLYFQIGDLGIGFPSLPYPKDFGDNFVFIRGNHDNPEVCRNHKNFLGDFGYIKSLDLFFLGGAWSIDWQYRINGVSWWQDEELSFTELKQAVEEYVEIKPRFLVSHDCPARLYRDSFFKKPFVIDTRTAQALDSCFEGHRPSRLIFGHHHISKSKDVDGTDCRCLNELETFEMNLE